MPYTTALISVVIPTTGRNLLGLKRALQSIRSGPLLPRRVIVALDVASQLPEDDLRQQLEPSYPGLMVVKSQGRRNAASTYNAGLRLVETEWVDFLDDDDEWLNGRLPALVGLLSAVAPDVVFAGSITYRTEAERLAMADQRGLFHGSYPVIEGLLGEKWYQDSGVIGRSTGGAYRTALIRQMGGFDESLPFGEWTDLYRRFPVGTHVVTLPGAWKLKDRTVHPSFSGNSTARSQAIAGFLAQGEAQPGVWAAVMLAAEEPGAAPEFQRGLPRVFLPVAVRPDMSTSTLLQAACERYQGACVTAVVHDHHPAYGPIYHAPPPRTIWRDAFLNRGQAEGASRGVELCGQTGFLANVCGVVVDSGWCWLPQSEWQELLQEFLSDPETPAYAAAGGRSSELQQAPAAADLPRNTICWLPRGRLLDLIAIPHAASLADVIAELASGERHCRRVQLPSLCSIGSWEDWAGGVSLALRVTIIDQAPRSDPLCAQEPR